MWRRVTPFSAIIISRTGEGLRLSATRCYTMRLIVETKPAATADDEIAAAILTTRLRRRGRVDWLCDSLVQALNPCEVNANGLATACGAKRDCERLRDLLVPHALWRARLSCGEERDGAGRAVFPCMHRRNCTPFLPRFPRRSNWQRVLSKSSVGQRLITWISSLFKVGCTAGRTM